MKEYIISDNIQALTGMQLVGVDGVLIDEETKFEDAFRAVLADDTIGVLMISPQLIASHQKQVDDVRFNQANYRDVFQPGGSPFFERLRSIFTGELSRRSTCFKSFKRVWRF